MSLLNDFKLGRKNEYEVNLGLQSVEVRAGVRRLRVTWTPEMAASLESYHNVDAEQELTRMLSEEMSRMIDDEIIQSLRRISDEIVPVQPLNIPIGELFYFDYKYMGINNFKFGR